MDIDARVGEAIRAYTDTVRPFAPELSDIRSAARRQARRRAALGIVVAVVAVAATWASVVAPQELRSLQPADVPDRSGQTVAIPLSRPDQVVVEAPHPSAVAGGTAVTMFGLPFPARAEARGRTWTLTHAAAGATGARNLSFTVEASDRDRIVQVVSTIRGAAFCRLPECLPHVRMRIDGHLVDTDDRGLFYAHAGWEELAAGDPHEIRIRLTGGDPASTEFGVVVYEAGALGP
jgi:hypothetical protein